MDFIVQAAQISSVVGVRQMIWSRRRYQTISSPDGVEPVGRHVSATASLALTFTITSQSVTQRLRLPPKTLMPMVKAGVAPYDNTATTW
jgi:hypothetical protein